MRIVTCNLNGIRSAEKKGFFKWVKTIIPDFICLQETKAQLKKMPLQQYAVFDLENYFRFEHDAQKPGYSGVAIYSKHQPLSVQDKLGFQCADTEGRYIELVYPNYHIISLYLPSGSSGDHRQTEKYNFMKHFEEFLKNIISSQKSYIICGDWNIAHQARDLKNWRSNQKNSGFLPAERAWLDKLFGDWGFIDVFREVNQSDDQYTWWSNRCNAYQNNVGWRIDYQIATPNWKNRVQYAEIYKTQKFSDHAPLIIDYEI